MENLPERRKRGRPKGSKTIESLDKIDARNYVRQLVTAKLKPLVEAQIQNALGLSHLFLKDKVGRFVQITDPKQIEDVLNSGEQDKYFYIQTKDPSTAAFTDLLNRALDKPAEHVEVTGADGKPLEVRWLP